MKSKLLQNFITAAALLVFPMSTFGQLPPNLGAASGFTMFTAVGAFNNVGATIVTGDVGTNVGGFTGFPPGTIIGQIHVADSVSAAAAPDVAVAYSYLANMTCGVVLGTTLGNGQLLTPDVYCLGAASTLNGNLVLDGQGNPNATFFFKIDGALQTGTFSNVTFINSASICNVYWQINGAFSLGENSVFRGTIIANGAISLYTGSTLYGRGLSTGGAINLSAINASNPGPTPVITGLVSVCAGSSGVTYSTEAGMTGYTWSVTGGTIAGSSTGNTISVNWDVAGPGTVSVNYTNANGCSPASAAILNVSVTSGIVATITGASTVCPSTSNNYTATAGMTTYAWSISGNGTITSALDAPTVTVLAGTNCNSTFTLTLIVTNSDGCNSTTTKEVNVNDTQLPVISTTATGSYLECNPTVIAPVFTGLDNCEGVFTPVVTTSGPSNTGCAYTQTWTANYTDACMNAALPVSITFTWTQDLVLPVITLTAASTLPCNPTTAQIEAAFGTATVTDNCSNGLIAAGTITIAAPLCLNCLYTATKNWTVMDNCYNIGTVSQSISYIVNTSFPTIVCPPDVTVYVNSGSTATGVILGTPTTYSFCGIHSVWYDHWESSTYPLGVTNVQWSASDLCGNISTCTQKVTVLMMTLSGTLKYYKEGGTDVPLNNVTLTLTPGGATSITDVNGNYSFPNLSAGTYMVSVTNNNKLPGSINSTDAAKVSYWSASPNIVEMVSFLSGDVANTPNFINATDALRIQQHFVLGTPFDRASWSYWKKGDMVLNNYNPSPMSSLLSVLLAGANMNKYDLYGMVTGDYNGSYSPGSAKSTNSSLTLINGSNMLVGPNQDFELPIRSTSAMEVGAVSLIIEIPSDLVEVTGVKVKGSSEPVAYAMDGNVLRIGWNSVSPVSTPADGNLVILKLRTKTAFTSGQTIVTSLKSDPLNELADGIYNAIDNAVLVIDIVDNHAEGAGKEVANPLTLSNYPNPFNNLTTVSYSIPVDGKVVLEVYNLLGQHQSTLVEENQSAGVYSLKFDGEILQQGVYSVRLKLSNDKVNMERSIRLVVNK